MPEQKMDASFEGNELVALSKAIAFWLLEHNGKLLNNDEILTMNYLMSAIVEIGRCLGEDWEVEDHVCLMIIKREADCGHLN